MATGFVERREAVTLKLKIQIYRGGDIAIGPGKADLLEAIDREGSISAGGRALGMSYRRAWMLVDTMNRCFREPLVLTKPGGSPGAGARLTDAGRRVLAAFRGLERSAAKAAAGDDMEVIAGLMQAPPPAVSR